MNIHRMAFNGDLEGVRKILASSPDLVNQQLEFKDDDASIHRITPIFLAAIQGHEEVVQLLVEHHAEIQSPNETDHLMDWIDFGPSINRHEILSCLAKKGKIKELKFIDKDYGQFHSSALKISSLLKRHGMDVGRKFDENEYFVLLGESASLEHIERLLDDSSIKSTLLEALYKGVLIAGRVDVLKLLQRNNIVGSSFQGVSPAYIAADKGHAELLPILYELGIDLTVPGSEGTPAFIAAYRGHDQVLRVLHKYGIKLDVPESIGEFKGYTPAVLAAQLGHPEVLRVLHESGADLSLPVNGGFYDGATLAVIAAFHDKAEVLRTLKDCGVDLSAPCPKGPKKGSTPACVGAFLGQIEVLRALKECGVDLSAQFIEGEFKGSNPLALAAREVKFDVLEFMKEEGIYQPFYPKTWSAEEKQGIREVYASVSFLSDLETAKLLCGKIGNDPSWFTIYKLIFFDYMEKIPAVDWVKSGSWKQLKKIFQRYLDLKGARKDWLLAVGIESINQSKVGMDPFEFCTRMNIQSLEPLTDAIRPGKPLLRLLEGVSQNEKIQKGSNLGKLNEWISRVLKQSSNDEEFWIEAKSYFRKIHAGIKSKPAQKPARGKGKGKQKPQQDPFVNLWVRFDQKLNDAMTPPEELEEIRSSKLLESAKEYDIWLRKLDPLIESLKKPMEGSNASDDEAIADYNSHIEEVFGKLVYDLIASDKSNAEKVEASREIKQRSKLSSNLAEFHQSRMDNAMALKNQTLNRVSELKQELKHTLEALRLQRDFKEKQQRMLAEELAPWLSEWEKIKTSVDQKAKSLWEQRQNLAQQATTEEQLESIREKYKSLLEEAHKMQTVPALPRGSDYLVQRNEALLQENKALRKQVEQLEKKASERPRSPDKIAPIVEKPTQVALIEKLSKLAGLSKKFQKALIMIEGQGKILASVDDMVKFLNLFKFELKNTVGSHRQFSDGKHHVTIANHTGESKPEEIEDVLRAVLSKLS